MVVNWRSSFLIVWIFVIANSETGQGDEAVLMDTRTATSDVGWTMPQGSEWQEVSSSHPDGSERRILMVCRIHNPRQNNWARTPYIPIEGAERVYVEFEFTIRSCEDLENVATCRETFNLYYYETDRDEATTTFPPWKEGAYVKVDTIAADKRFRPGSEETNFETRDIGPLSKKGIYLALQDTGACMAIMHVRVYYKYCSPTGWNLANFPRTISGPERASLVESQGICVDHALTKNLAATLHCNSDGEWTVPKGECICDAGFNPNPTQTSCKACARGFYKASAGNRPCQRCPAYSHSRAYGAKECDCMFGYFRATSDDATAPCTKSPSTPTNLRATVNHTRVVLNWGRPLNDGGRNDLTYRVECSRCQSRFTDCTSCSSDLGYIPMKTGLLVSKVEIRGLRSFAFYKFKVFAENAVSEIALKEGVDINPAVVTIETEQAAPSRIEEVHVTQVASGSFLVTWNIPGGHGRGVQFYEVRITDDVNQEVVKRNQTTERSISIVNLMEGTEYVVEVRARSSAGYGPFSLPVKTQTKKLEATSPPQHLQEDTISTFQILIAIVVGIVIIVALVFVTFYCRRRNRRNKRRSKIDFEKYPMFNTSTLLSSGSYPNTQKTYIDPTTYEDPQRAVLDFTKEIDASFISIEQVIGGGEFGEVCRGHMMLPSSKQDHDIAIKTLKTGYSTQQKLDFLGEASIMGQFEHPNVIRLEGVVTRSRPFMIITEYMENGSLDSFLRKHDGEFTVLQLVGMLRNIAAGMKYLSDMGYVHRDLAARNILVNAQLVCKVSDFGMSRVLEEDGDATYTTRGGKIPIRWTAPEAITYRKFTSASDVWSFGIVMWEVMSYGERPYWGMSNQDVIQAVGTGYRLPAPMDCPQVQHQLMVDCWKKNRNERPKFSTIVTSIDKMLRDPSQLKEKAGQPERKNGCLLPEGSFARLSRQDTPAESMLSAPLLPPQSFSKSVSRNSADISSLGDWLASIGLGAYKESFIQFGCSTLEQILQLKPSDLEKIGVTDINHQNTVLESVYSLQRSNEYYHNKDPPQYRDELVTGIPV